MTISAEQGAMAEVGSPVDIAPDALDSAEPARWATLAIACAALFLLLFNAHAIAGWFDDLTPSSTTARLGPPIAHWADATAKIGLDGPRAALHGRWEAVKAARFGGEQPGEEGAGDAP